VFPTQDSPALGRYKDADNTKHSAVLSQFPELIKEDLQSYSDMGELTTTRLFETTGNKIETDLSVINIVDRNHKGSGR
jgi:hypothetical protein